jgi:hypothetical protein
MSDEPRTLARGRGGGPVLALVVHDAVALDGQALRWRPKAGIDTPGRDLL